MCLIFFALHQHPKYKLIVAANRDEFYNRKTASADFWPDQPHILGGRDLEAGGTWMGITRNGRISMITNYRDPHNIDPHAPSRGQLVADFLQGEQAPDTFLKQIEPSAKAYNGFNLVTGTPDELAYFSNYRDGVDKLEKGIYGLSNHLLDSPWPKVVKGKNRFKEIIGGQDVLPEALFEFMFDDAQAADDQLPDTGVGLERERVLSSMFIKSPGYGTRCSTVIFIDNENHVRFSERVFDTSTFTFTEKTFTFQVS